MTTEQSSNALRPYYGPHPGEVHAIDTWSHMLNIPRDQVIGAYIYNTPYGTLVVDYERKQR